MLTAGLKCPQSRRIRSPQPTGQAVGECNADDAAPEQPRAWRNGRDAGEAEEKCSEELCEKSLMNFHGRSVRSLPASQPSSRRA